VRHQFVYVRPEDPLMDMQRNRWGSAEPTDVGRRNHELFTHALDTSDPSLIIVDGMTALEKSRIDRYCSQLAIPSAARPALEALFFVHHVGHRIHMALADHGLRDKVRVMVGGAPLNEAFAREYGADIYCRDARGAVEAAKRIMQTRQGERL